MAMFAAHGFVQSVTIARDRETLQSRGFAFLEMPNEDEARQAMAAISGTQINGRALVASEAGVGTPDTSQKAYDRPVTGSRFTKADMDADKAQRQAKLRLSNTQGPARNTGGAPKRNNGGWTPA